MSVSDFGEPSKADFGTPATPTAAPQEHPDFGSPSASAADFGVPSGHSPGLHAPAPAPKDPTPVATPHDYDGAIKISAAQHGLQPNILRALGMQETGLGTGANFDKKTGLDKDGNQGHGLFQLDPASGASASDLMKAAKDPQFAADYAAKMMQQNLAATHGDLRAAYSMYNSGSPTSPKGLKYADEVMARQRALDPMHIPPEIGTRVDWHVQHVVKALQNKKDPMKALSHTPELAHMTHEENQVKQTWSWLKGHALEGIGDVMGTPMRAVQDIVSESKDPKAVQNFLSNDPKKREMLQRFNQAVWNPTPVNQKRLQEGFRQGFNKEMDRETKGRVSEPLKTNAEVDKAIKAHIWKPLAPAASATAQTANDFAQQTIADPLTALDVAENLGGKAIKALGQTENYAHITGQVQKGLQAAGGVMRSAYNLMPKEAQAAFDHLPKWIDHAEQTGNRLFGVRRDLDEAGFTREGKKARMALENRHIAEYNDTKNEINKIAHDPDMAADHYLQQAKKVGVKPSMMQDHIDMLQDAGTTAKDRADLLSKLARGIRNKNILEDTEKLVDGKNHLYTGSKAGLKNINVDQNAGIDKFMKEHLAPVHALAGLGKQAILWNSLPHAFINEGTLTYMAGGLPAIMHGVKSMIVPAADEDVQFLKEYGALPTHMLDETDPKHPVLRFGNAVNHASQAALEHIELGWRVGLMKTLENQLGKPKTEEEKLIRGWLINDKVGDYRNQNAFTNMFRILGGPFTAFHLGIVPKMYMQTLRDNPGRIMQYQRAGEDIQNHASPSMQQFLHSSNPMNEGSDMLIGLGSLAKGEMPKYVMDTLPMEDFEDKDKDYEGMLERWGKIAGHYLAPVSIAEQYGSIAAGENRPGEHNTSLSERLMDATLATIGIQWRKKETPKKQAQTHREINKGSI